MTRIYLAGPDVFRKDALAWGQRLQDLCRLYGFEPLYPGSQAATDAHVIYQTNIAMIQSASAVVANFDPFRGAEIDSGTAFEAGYAVALGKPVVGYVGSADLLVARVAKHYGLASEQDQSGFTFDRTGHWIETFQNPVNLMLAESCHVVVGDIEDALAKLCALGVGDQFVL